MPGATARRLGRPLLKGGLVLVLLVGAFLVGRHTSVQSSLASRPTLAMAVPPAAVPPAPGEEHALPDRPLPRVAVRHRGQGARPANAAGPRAAATAAAGRDSAARTVCLRSWRAGLRIHSVCTSRDRHVVARPLDPCGLIVMALVLLVGGVAWAADELRRWRAGSHASLASHAPLASHPSPASRGAAGK